MRKLILPLVICLSLALSAIAAEPQVAGLNVSHRSGQTFITWKEVDLPQLDKNCDDAAVRQLARELDDGKLHYRIYRGSNRIDSVEGLTPIAEAKPLSCWNIDYYGESAQEGKPALRYVIEDGVEPLPPGTGLYVHNPALPGSPVSVKSYYAVTVVKNGTESKGLTEANRTSMPVEETEGRGAPVLQRIVKPDSFNYTAYD